GQKRRAENSLNPCSIHCVVPSSNGHHTVAGDAGEQSVCQPAEEGRCAADTPAFRGFLRVQRRQRAPGGYRASRRPRINCNQNDQILPLPEKAADAERQTPSGRKAPSPGPFFFVSTDAR